MEHRPNWSWGAAFAVAEWWGYRELAFHLALKDIKVRYRQTLFGVAWAVLRPLLAMGIFSVVLGHFAKLPSDGRPYPVFVLTGLAFWGFLLSAVESAAQSLVAQRELVEKVWFPRVLAPAAAVLAALIDLTVSLVLVGVAMAAWSVGPPLALLTLPLWMAAAVVLAIGVSLWLAGLNVLYRDVQYALGFILQLWFYASPVIYPSSLVHGGARWALALNPAVVLLDGARWSLIGGPAPPIQDLLSAGSGLLVTITGFIYFARAERHFADRI